MNELQKEYYANYVSRIFLSNRINRDRDDLDKLIIKSLEMSKKLSKEEMQEVIEAVAEAIGDELP